MTTYLLKANLAVNEDRGRVAFQRGPVVFCIERLDQAEVAEQSGLVGFTTQLEGATTTQFEPKLLDGVLVLEHPGSFERSSKETGLYFPAAENEKTVESAVTLRLIPYYAWANRTPSAMQVWIAWQNS